MREILFRGKRVDNGEWVEGSLVQFSEGYCLIIVPESVDTTALKAESISYLVDPKKIGQFTGLTDKNGKKIFEGDYVKCTNYHGEVTGFVVWGGEGVYFLNCNSGFSCERLFNCSDFEILGNIYDNPELLEE